MDARMKGAGGQEAVERLTGSRLVHIGHLRRARSASTS